MVVPPPTMGSRQVLPKKKLKIECLAFLHTPGWRPGTCPSSLTFKKALPVYATVYTLNNFDSCIFFPGNRRPDEKNIWVWAPAAGTEKQTAEKVGFRHLLSFFFFLIQNS